jgi:hypothetical protein
MTLLISAPMIYVMGVSRLNNPAFDIWSSKSFHLALVTRQPRWSDAFDSSIIILDNFPDRMPRNIDKCN